MLQRWWMVGVVGLMLVLGGCASAPATSHYTKRRRIKPVVATPNGVLSVRDQRRMQRKRNKLIRPLRRHGIFVQVGDKCQVILSAKRLFHRHSPCLRPRAYPVLTQVSRLLASYTKVWVDVSGISADGNASKQSFALSRARAAKIANFFQSQHTDIRLLSSQGQGVAALLATDTDDGHARIVITWHQVIDRPAEQLI